jgi:predicted RNA-binding Zn-ribbon protein involved in translation (DUF1610 family)
MTPALKYKLEDESMSEGWKCPNCGRAQVSTLLKQERALLGPDNCFLGRHDWYDIWSLIGPARQKCAECGTIRRKPKERGR